MSMQTERRTESERVLRRVASWECGFLLEGLGEPGRRSSGGYAEPGLGERGVVLVHEGRGAEVVVLVELVERPTLR
jgi:hypothetical protein